MKKIIYISSLFAPDNAIGAIRSTKFAKYLALSKEYEITVIKEKNEDIVIDGVLNKEIKLFDYHEFDCGKKAKRYQRFVKRLMKTKSYKEYSEKKIDEINQKTKNKKSIKRWLAKKIVDRMNCIEEKGFAKNAIRYLKKNNIEFDIIISSFGPMSNHEIALKIKKMKKNSKWVADYRDPVLYKTLSRGYARYYFKTNKKVLKIADEILFSSSGCNVMFDDGFLKRDDVKYVTNGFDKDDIARFKDTQSELFELTYCGQIYRHRSDLSYTFKCIRELIDEKKVDINKICINYAGTSIIDITKQIEKYNLQECFINYGLILREKALELQKGSKILLLASWNTKDSQGILTGKFFEYMMMNKPIIATITGDVPNSSIKQMMAEGNLGVCCEEANIEDDYLILKDYILQMYNDFIISGKIEFCPNTKYIEQFDYKNLTNKLIDIIEQ